MKRTILTTGMILAVLAMGCQSVQELKPSVSRLFKAVGINDYKTVQRQIRAGADVHAKDDKSGKTALMLASSRGYTKIVMALLASKADVKARDKHGSTALSYAKGNKHTEIVRLLKAAGATE